MIAHVWKAFTHVIFIIKYFTLLIKITSYCVSNIFNITLNILLEEYGQLSNLLFSMLQPLAKLYFALIQFKTKPAVVHLVS